jgi:hypothetical protein
MAETLSIRTLRLLHSILNHFGSACPGRDKVKRNAIILGESPTGQLGRPSKALTLDQAEATLTAAEASPMRV